MIKTNKHNIEAVVDRLSGLKDASRLRESLEKALKIADGEVIVSEVLDASFEFPEKPQKMEDHLFSEKFACPVCNISLPEVEPSLFSFNAPAGACPKCTGLGFLLKIDPELVVSS